MISETIFMSEGKNPEVTFDLARARCQKDNKRVLVMRDHNHAVMEFTPPMGDMSEVPAKELVVSMGASLVEQVVKTSLDKSHRAKDSNGIVLDLLKGFGDRGGKI